MPQTQDAIFYQLYFQKPGVAETELERDHRRTIQNLLYWGSGDAHHSEVPIGSGSGGMIPRSGGFLSSRSDPEKLPPWMTEADIDFYAGEFKRTGFSGGLNWYRNIDRNWELLKPWVEARVSVPALYIAGDRDVVLSFKGMNHLLANLKTTVPLLTQSIILRGCGHWTQQERPKEVNAAMIEFLNSLA
jgi:pimeloyl-ACP methyl ester carboxylesterase